MSPRMLRRRGKEALSPGARRGATVRYFFTLAPPFSPWTSRTEAHIIHPNRSTSAARRPRMSCTTPVVPPLSRGVFHTQFVCQHDLARLFVSLILLSRLIRPLTQERIQLRYAPGSPTFATSEVSQASDEQASPVPADRSCRRAHTGSRRSDSRPVANVAAVGASDPPRQH